MHTETRHQTSSFAARVGAWILIVLAFFVIAEYLPAADLRIQLANDPAQGNPRPDDQYTSDLLVELQFERIRVSAGERMFTDRVGGSRFDETHLSVATDLPPIRGWTTEGALGVLHTGRGFLGQPVQNQVHEWIGSAEVNLPYVNSEWFATADLRLTRPLAYVSGSDLRANVDAHVSPGFRTWTRATVVVETPLPAGAALQIGIGARYDVLDTEWLAGSVAEGVSPTARASLAWQSVEVRWSWNEYGTQSPHLALALRVPLNFSPGGY